MNVNNYKIANDILIIDTNNNNIMNYNILEQQINLLKSKLITNKNEYIQKISYINMEKLIIEQNQKLSYEKTNIEIKDKMYQLFSEESVNKSVIEQLDKQLISYIDYKESIIKNNELNKQIQEISLIRDNLKEELNLVDKVLYSIDNQIKNNNQIIEKVRLFNEELNVLKTEQQVYSYLSSMVGVNGIQLYLLKAYIDKISSRINNILEPFIHKKIRLNVDNDKINIIIEQNNKQIYTLSGMESFMLDLTMIIIINEISQIPKSNIMFIDESISVLDKERIENINELFIFMKVYFNQVYMITHMTQVKNKIDYKLDIHKMNMYSLINNQNKIMYIEEI